jgi:hypothetical protein
MRLALLTASIAKKVPSGIGEMKPKTPAAISEAVAALS